MNENSKLNKDKIVEVALAMIDQDGAKAFSMRKLAHALGVDPMAIYHHHKSKSALMQEVMQTMLLNLEIPESTGVWQDEIRTLSRGVRRLALAHPGSFQVFEYFDEWVPAEHRMREAFYEIFLKAGFSKAQTVEGARVLLTFVEGFTVDETSGWFGKEEHEDLAESLKEGPYDVLLGLVDEMGAMDTGASFEFGLSVVISGLEKHIPGLSHAQSDD